MKVFDHREDGAVVIKLKRGYTAKLCVEKLNGRFFNKRKLSCVFWDGITNYAEKYEWFNPRVSPVNAHAVVCTRRPQAAQGKPQSTGAAEEEDEKRLDAFGDWLEGDSDSDDDDLAVVTEA